MTRAVFRGRAPSACRMWTSVMTRRAPIASPKPAPPRRQVFGRTPRTVSFTAVDAFPVIAVCSVMMAEVK
jgi:hypothetical protein